MPVTFRIQDTSRIPRAISALPDRIEAGVKVSGPAAAYALVWEWGSARITKPGPKTTWGINPAGKAAILTLTAPYGYIRSNRTLYAQILRTGFRELVADVARSRDFLGGFLLGRLRGTVQSVAAQCANVIRDSAPEDSGDLKASIQPTTTEDPLLRNSGGTEFSFDRGGAEWL